MSEESADDEISEAQRILSWRPGVQPTSLPSKGGPKFFGTSEIGEEDSKVDAQLDKYASVLHAEKVRKLGNLGSAEWIESLGIAKITKQGKFMQSMGHHNSEFFVLFAEEALFLLDIGDLELTLNDVPLALQEAFSMIFGNDKSCCAIQEYQVYSYLVKRGYIVQRFKFEKGSEKVKTLKRKHSQDDGLKGTSKELKADDELPVTDSSSQTSLTRGWNMQSLSALQYPVYTSSTSQEVTFPNLSNRLHTHLPKPDQSLIPPNINIKDYDIEEIWYQRIKKDLGDKKSSLQNSNISRGEIARRAKTWTQYRQMLDVAKKKETENYFKLLNKMQSGPIKPLLHPAHSSSVARVTKAITLSKEINGQHLELRDRTSAIKYNVYKTDSVPFKKTNPGRPFCRVVVTTIHDKFPDTGTIISVNEQSNGIPVKYAVVDFGQISFFTFEEGNVPIIIKDADFQ